jgi:hypothetical protein
MSNENSEALDARREWPADVSDVPLQLIHEKEAEFAELLLGAKRQADDMVADARTKAADVVRVAEDGSARSGENEARILRDADAAATRLRGEADADAARIRTLADERREDAVRLVLDAVTTVRR